ncbi:MAG: SH3 domain-containing protein [Lachnospiraceae bacterium]|nr:SH3 domain-containing protein [Lachnospiraceae bacterium]
MANRDAIVNALGEAREHLILNKFNEAMMLMAQITIDVIEHLTDEALIVSKGYDEDLKTLKTVGIIADDTAHNFETIIISGVQAHNGVDIPKEHAEEALQVLTNELDLIFKNEDAMPSMTDNLDEKAKFNAENADEKVYEYSEDEDTPYAGDFSRDMTVEGSAPAFMQRDDDDFRRKEMLREQMLQNENRRPRRNRRRLMSIIIPIVAILLMVFVVRAIFFRGEREEIIETEPVVEIIETEPIETEPIETEPVETEPPQPPEAGYYNVTGDLVKIRNAPNTDSSRVYGTVSKGDRVQVRSFYDNDWAIVSYEGEEAYISRRYIVRDETLSPSGY